jgi:MYXO-CTERM domain-containing protein
MDFFETWFGISPDHGDGSLEAIWVVALLVLVGAFLMRRRIGGHLRALRRSDGDRR